MIPVEPFELRGVPFSLQTASTRSVMSSKKRMALHTVGDLQAQLSEAARSQVAFFQL